MKCPIYKSHFNNHLFSTTEELAPLSNVKGFTLKVTMFNLVKETKPRKFLDNSLFEL